MIQQPHSWVYIQKRQKLLIQKDTYTAVFIAALFIYNSQDMEAT